MSVPGLPGRIGERWMTAAPLRLKSINSPLMSESCTGIDVVGVRSARRRSRPEAMSSDYRGCPLPVARCREKSATGNWQLNGDDCHAIAAAEPQQLRGAGVGHG